MKRMQNQKGESLVESLCAILIVAVVFAFLSQAIASAARTNHLVAESDQSFAYADMSDQDGVGVLEIQVTGVSGTSKYSVHQYVTQSQGEEPPDYVYRRYVFGGARP